MKTEAKKAAAKQEPERQEIVKATDLGIVQAPAYLTEYAKDRPEGFEEVQPNDVKIARLALAQALTPNLNEDDANYIPNLKKGQFFNTITHEVYGERVRFIPLFKFGTRFRFKGMDEGGG